MSDLTSLLHAANIKNAVIIDDAYEQIPLAKDLLQDEQNWRQFFEDLNVEDIKLIIEFFPLYDTLRADQLRGNDDFVAVVWKNQAKLRGDIVNPLFERYKRDKEQDLAYLDTLTSCLTQYGIQCVPVGREFEEAATKADLIVIDLFLSSTQDNGAIESSVNGLKQVINKRLANPPLVVLMSRSTRLEEERKDFRDNSGLFESAFRIIRKTELAEEGKLPRLLMRLAEHYQDSIKLATFLYAWRTGLDSACYRTANLIRTLDLADHAQIRQLLLTDEGEPPGSYLVDVFDLVLQHEIEREASIIDAAIELNGLNSDAYPPPYVAGSPDLQALVYRSLFQNNGRLRLLGASGSPVLFGDVLCRKPVAPAPVAAAPVAAAPVAAAPVATAPVATAPVATAPAFDIPAIVANVPFSDMGPLDVFVVMTPPCDLQRLLAKRVLLLKGSLVSLTPANWSYKETPVRTAVYETPSGERFQIKWDLKHIEAISQAELKGILDAPHGFEIAARLREAHALELQQKLLSNLGRVGLLAPMPATFPVNVEAYLPDANRKLFKIAVPGLTHNQGVCFVGRKNEVRATTLVLCEDACEDLCKAIQSIPLDTIHPMTRETVVGLRASGDLLVLQKGVDFSDVTDQFRDIVSVSAATEGKPEEKRVIGLIRQSGAWLEEPLNGGCLKKAGIVLVVSN